MFSRQLSPLIRRNWSLNSAHNAHRGTRAMSSSSVLKKFDRSMLYPTLLVVLLGSQIMNVMNMQTSCEDMERRYELKISKIDEIIKRIQNGEKLDIAKEMELVNKNFERKANKINLKSTSDKFGGHFSNKKQKDLRFDDNLKLDDELTDEQLSKLFGLDQEVVNVPLESKNQIKDQVPARQLTQEELKQQMKNEKELLKYKLAPDRHVVVENPGDYVEAAKDTKISGFL